LSNKVELVLTHGARGERGAWRVLIDTGDTRGAVDTHRRGRGKEWEGPGATAVVAATVAITAAAIAVLCKIKNNIKYIYIFNF